MNLVSISELEPKVEQESPAPERIELLQSLVSALEVIRADRIDEETPMPDDVALEIMLTFEEESNTDVHEEINQDEGVKHGPQTKAEADEVAKNAKPKEENNWKIRLYPKIDSEDEKIPVMVGHKTTIGSDFMAGFSCSVGKKSVIGSGCKISTRIPKRVSVGNNCTISNGSTIGTESSPKKDDEFQLVIGDNVYIGNSATVKQQTTTGNNVFIGEGAKVGINPKKKDKFKPTRIGNNCIVEQESTVENGASVGEDCHIAENALVKTGAEIGDNCYVGEGAVVSAGAKIGKGYIIDTGLDLDDYGKINIDDNLLDEQIVIDKKWLSDHGIYRTYKKPVYYP